jgi:hypothetical protein
MTMRNSFDIEPRFVVPTWTPRTLWSGSGFSLTLPGSRWSRHARRASFWQMGEIVRRPR